MDNIEIIFKDKNTNNKIVVKIQQSKEDQEDLDLTVNFGKINLKKAMENNDLLVACFSILINGLEESSESSFTLKK
jgi:hypothetical protein